MECCWRVDLVSGQCAARTSTGSLTGCEVGDRRECVSVGLHEDPYIDWFAVETKQDPHSVKELGSLEHSSGANMLIHRSHQVEIEPTVAGFPTSQAVHLDV